MHTKSFLLTLTLVASFGVLDAARCFVDTQDLWIFGDLEVYTNPPSAGQRTAIDLNGVRMTIKSDGNLQILEIATGVELWNSKVSSQDCSKGCRCALQGDGNFVCSTSTTAYWSTGTYNCCNNTRAADKAWFSSQQPYFMMMNTGCQIVWSPDSPAARTQAAPIYGSTGFITPQPVASNQFYVSFGVNTHLSQGWNLNTTITLATQVGASTIREGIVDNLISSYKAVADAGLKLNLLPISSNNLNISDNIRILETAATNSPGAITSVEGFNEVNNQPFTYNGVDPKTSYAGMAQAMKDLYNGVKSSSILKNIPVYDLTAGNSGPDSASLGLTQLSGYADYANIHPYSYQGDNSIVGWSYFSSNMNGDYPAWQLNWPRVITELGWPTLVYSSNSQGVSEIAQAKLTVNTLLSSIKNGYRQCFIYELIDETWGNPQNTEEHFGLFRHDSSAKPVATVLRTIVGLLKDSGNPTLAPLNYSVDGYPLTTGRNLLFQMQNPTPSYWLAIWNDEAIWNPMSQTDVETQPFPLSISLGNSKVADFTIYNPYSTVIPNSAPASQSFPGVSKVNFQADDYLLLVQIKNLH